MRRCAIERSLRARDAFDALDVIDVHRQEAENGRNRLFVEIDADGRERCGVVAVAARDDTAEIDRRRVRSGRLIGKAWNELRIIVESRDFEFFELLGAKGLDADRHVLQAFRLFLRRDRNFIDLRERGARDCQH